MKVIIVALDDYGNPAVAILAVNDDQVVETLARLGVETTLDALVEGEWYISTIDNAFVVKVNTPDTVDETVKILKSAGEEDVDDK